MGCLGRWGEVDEETFQFVNITFNIWHWPSINLFLVLFFALFLHLTVRIGAMLAYTPLDEKSLALLLSYLEDFLK